jgi:tRNA C32,U32 (ribose-2'-O)-methylase TrmJ
MKSIILIFGFLTVTATTINVTAKKEEKAVTEDKEFEQFMNDFNSTLTKNKAVQVKADQAKEAIVTSTVSKFAEIKQEVNTLKNELNEVKQTLDSVSNDTAISFKLLPISHHKKD